jgi:molybdenum cofactor cytidylyltransferase
MRRIAIAILAAGRGSRFDRSYPKSLARLAGKSLLAHSLTAAIDSDLHPILLVTGYSAEQVAAAALPNVRVVYNRKWEQGIASSLQAAIQVVLGDRSIDALCVGLADQPGVGAEAYCRLAGAYDRGAALAVATYGGVRGNPVLLARSMWAMAMQLEGDVGARRLMELYPVVEVPCEDTGNSLDVDTLSDLQALAQTIGSSLVVSSY